MNQLADFLVWMQIEEPNMPLDRNEREGYFYHDIVEKMWKAWKVSHMHWTPLAGRISPEKKRSFKEDDFPDTLVDRLKGVSRSAMGAQKPNKIEMEAAREIERLRSERDELVKDAERYRWIREEDNWTDDGNAWAILGESSHSEFDSLIDAAISALRENYGIQAETQ